MMFCLALSSWMSFSSSVFQPVYQGALVFVLGSKRCESRSHFVSTSLSIIVTFYPRQCSMNVKSNKQRKKARTPEQTVHVTKHQCHWL